MELHRIGEMKLLHKCPKCFSRSLGRSRPRDSDTRLLYWFGLRPFRCAKCGYRFFHFNWGK